MIRRVFQCPSTTPLEAYQLELGILPLSFIVKERRVNYLYYVITSDKSEMLYKFFIAQWEDPIKKDWVEQVRTDLEDLGIKLNVDEIEKKSEFTFKKMEKIKKRGLLLTALMR